MNNHKSNMHPQDILILLKMISLGNHEWYHHTLAKEIGISQSEVSHSLTRSQIAGLVDSSRKKVRRLALLEFLLHGIRYVFPQQPGPIVRGIPTSHSAPPLQKYFGDSEAYVWPSTHGKVRGQAITPLYPSVIGAIEKDEKLYQLLALVDAMRVGKSREKELAKTALEAVLLNGE